MGYASYLEHLIEQHQAQVDSFFTRLSDPAVDVVMLRRVAGELFSKSRQILENARSHLAIATDPTILDSAAEILKLRERVRRLESDLAVREREAIEATALAEKRRRAFEAERRRADKLERELAIWRSDDGYHQAINKQQT